ncbi:lipid kinase [soil metagenome]
MKKPSRALLIVNASSRQGAADLTDVKTLLERRGLALHQVTPENAAGVASLIERHAPDVDRVIVGGGDGTLNCAAGALVKSGLPLGILPLGTANDLARTLGLPSDVRDAAEVIANGHAREVDVGCVNGVYFFNAADVGLGARVTARLDRETKSRWGILAYPHGVMSAWREHRAFAARVRCEGHEEIMRVIELKIANGKYYGGGTPVLEDAAIDDERLDLLAIRPLGFFRLLKIALALRAGAARDAEGVRVRSGRRIEITTRKPMDVSTDGEIRTTTPARFHILPRAIKVFAPATDRENTEDPGHAHE